MFIKLFCLLVAFSFVFSIQKASAKNVRDGGQSPQFDRRKQLIAALKSDSPIIFYRAVEELGVLGGFDSVAARDAIKALSNQIRKSPSEFGFSYPLVGALATGGPAIVPNIIEVIKSKDTSEEVSEGLFFVLGRMGPDGKKAIPFLKERLVAPESPPQTKVVIRVVLANIGEDSKENLEAISSALEDQVVTGRAMILTNSSGWVTSSLIKQITEGANDENFIYPIALGMLGKKANLAVDKLTKLNQLAIKQNSSAQLAFSLALARIDPKRRDNELRRLCRALPDFVGHVTGNVIAENPFALLDDEMIDSLVKLVEDPDFLISKGSLAFLSGAGLAARGAVPRLLKFVESNAEEERRILVAHAMESIADYSKMPQLEETLKKVQSRRVRRALERSIRFIRDLSLPED